MPTLPYLFAFAALASLLGLAGDARRFYRSAHDLWCYVFGE